MGDMQKDAFASIVTPMPAPKPWYKKIIFWVLMALAAFVIFAFLHYDPNRIDSRADQIELLCNYHYPDDNIGRDQCKTQLSAPGLAPYLDEARRKNNGDN